jgi:hypothetical protein
MHNRTVFLIKPDGTVGYEFQVGLLTNPDVGTEARNAALERIRFR